MVSTPVAFLGLRAAGGQQPANWAPAFILLNWFYAYCHLSPRFAKMSVGLDHNLSPREDITKYGETAVQGGKLSRQRLDQIKRMQSAHENSVEGFTLFVAAGEPRSPSFMDSDQFGNLTESSVLFTTLSSVPNTTTNAICYWYTLSRLAYGAAYIYIDTESLSIIRTAIWWSCNASCITAIILAARAM